MAFREFSTGQADYLLLLENHVRATNDAVISRRLPEVDAFVLEHTELGGSLLDEARWLMFRLVNSFSGRPPERPAPAGGPGQSGDEHPASRPAPASPVDPQDQLGAVGDLIERAALGRGEPFSCFIVDINLTSAGLYGSYAVTLALGFGGGLLISRSNRILRRAGEEDRRVTRRELLRIGSLLGAGFFLLGDLIFSPLVALVPGPLREPWRSVLASRMLLSPTPLVEVRNAVLARKLEETVVPLLARELGRRPTVAIFYGGRHLTIENYLCSPLERDALLGAWKAIRHAGAELQHLRRILRLTFSPSSRTEGSWALEELPSASPGDG